MYLYSLRPTYLVSLITPKGPTHSAHPPSGTIHHPYGVTQPGTLVLHTPSPTPSEVHEKHSALHGLIQLFLHLQSFHQGA
jgi:hypothetical protein